MRSDIELLQKVERGEISAEEASRLLEQMQDYQVFEPEQEGSKSYHAAGEDQDSETLTATGDLRKFGRFTRWWIIPYTFGVLITALGAFWIYLGWNGGEITFGFWIAWLPFISGVAFMALSWRARASHWIHLRVQQQQGRRPERFTISMPLPLGIIKWANRTFGHHFPQEVRGIDLDDFIDSIEESVTSDNPIYVWVDDAKEQQQVEIWIGRGADRDV